MKSKNFILSLMAFVFLNLALYLFIFLFNSKVPFNNNNYINNAHHYIQDSRVILKKFKFINALGQYDSQWYLGIADVGYPRKSSIIDTENKTVLSGLSYAFFPFYPLAISVFNIILKNIELSAFVLTNILLILNFFSLFFVIKKLFSEELAIKTIFLLFFFPFSIFYRSYFTEGMLLLIITWFSYFLVLNRYFLSSLLLGLLNITKGNGILLNLVFFYYLTKFLKGKKNFYQIKEIILKSVFAFTPFIVFLIYIYFQTGSLSYLIEIRDSWVPNEFPLLRLLHNFLSILSFLKLPLHLFHNSKIDALVVLITLQLLLLGRKKIPLKLWLVSFSLWLTPLMFSDLMSFTRHQTVSFPLFLYLSMVLKGPVYQAVFAVFIAGLFIVSLFFINWYWIG
ncbi:MAG: hypothetical protein A2629_00340 [Candidatus Levybacteria bacterium RIFCSPHIGHO2_01_FULL_41_15]|nr:MAG: hypothetical protein A2629_00340 [Candidatus Levybacteria bacterium RIFCSPHIGHO2_01_FULL_41_15]